EEPSTTESWISFHLAVAAGLDASLCRITRARLNATPAARRRESSRLKFSSARAEIFSDFLPNGSENGAGRGEPLGRAAPGFSARATRGKPRPCILPTLSHTPRA